MVAVWSRPRWAGKVFSARPVRRLHIALAPSRNAVLWHGTSGDHSHRRYMPDEIIALKGKNWSVRLAMGPGGVKTPGRKHFLRKPNAGIALSSSS